MLLFAVGAIIFALVRWKVNPRASLITAIAFAIYLIDAFAYSTFLYFVPDLTRSLELTPSNQRWMYSVLYFLEDIVMAVIIILLTAAAFIGRDRSTPIPETI